ncbi:hypothetical protein AMTR_s00089p00105460 [Amborella trichopoda]|uniref:non-specific serine/threonine protein kinase n=1 Tax=Amborella trichopoda TaxID=13333 RepID=W1NW50_AMBTC|nr:hypothetical protein AMTR_s00089p00105460 [Amborella trichopoda]
MTATHDIPSDLRSITDSSVFNCGLFRENVTAFRRRDEIGSGVRSLIPKNLRARDKVVSCWDFKLDTNTLAPANIRVLALAAGDYFTCGVLAYSQFAGVRAFQQI